LFGHTCTAIILITSTTKNVYQPSINLMKTANLARLLALVAALGISSGLAHSQVIFATQYGDSGTGKYTGPLFDGATVTYQLLGGGSPDGKSFSLGSGPGSDLPVLTYTSGVGGAYNNGQSGSSTDLTYLNHTYIYGGQPSSPALVLTLTGVSATDTVDFKFLNALPDDQAGSYTITPFGGTASAPVTVSSATNFTDIGSFTGATSYTITATSQTVYNTEISADLITITPAAALEPSTYALLAAGALLLGALRLRTPGRFSI
jgi:hypothetical protein